MTQALGQRPFRTSAISRPTLLWVSGPNLELAEATCGVRITLSIASNGLFGSGGGGGIPAGGGLAFSVQIGLSFKLSDKFALTVNVGHLNFPNGTFNTNIINKAFILFV